jgi:hypothetical protein
MPAPKCRHATVPVLEARTPIASLSGENVDFCKLSKNAQTVTEK